MIIIYYKVSNKVYEFKKFRNTKFTYNSFIEEKYIVDKFFKTLETNKKLAYKYIKTNRVSLFEDINTIKSYKHLNTEKFNFVNYGDYVKEVSIHVLNNKNDSKFAKIILFYSPDRYSEYKIADIQFFDKKWPFSSWQL